MSKILVSGIQPSGRLHIGNYFGALKQFVDLQNKYDSRFIIVDLHALTSLQNADELRENTIETYIDYLAAGLDPEKCLIFKQSDTPEVTELAWIFDCLVSVPFLMQAHAYKDKVAKGLEASAGLFTYPMLMAADILIQDAEVVPVGEDQRQHLELTRDLALRMNNKFGELFTVPNEWEKQLSFVGLDRGIRIRSLRNPEKKMSKSIEDPAGTIMITDNPDEAAAKIMSATTDSVGKINYDWENQPGITNLLQMLALCGNRTQKEVYDEWNGKESYGELKKAVADSVKNILTELQQSIANVDENMLVRKLEEDESKMTEVANQTLAKVQKAVGIRQ